MCTYHFVFVIYIVKVRIFNTNDIWIYCHVCIDYRWVFFKMETNYATTQHWPKIVSCDTQNLLRTFNTKTCTFDFTICIVAMWGSENILVNSYKGRLLYKTGQNAWCLYNDMFSKVRDMELFVWKDKLNLRLIVDFFIGNATDIFLLISLKIKCYYLFQTCPAKFNVMMFLLPTNCDTNYATIVYFALYFSK